MIKANISELQQYAHLHPNFRTIFTILDAFNLDALEVGHIELDGSYVFINIDHVKGRTTQESPLESHKRYIDIQVPISGPEKFGYKPTEKCTEIKKAFDEELDIAFYNDKPSEIINVEKGEAIIFFPEDAHAPCICDDPNHFKMVVKVSVEPNLEVPKL